MDIIKIEESLMLGKKPDVIMNSANIFIMGGAIRSWFTGTEKTSDIDVFADTEIMLEKFKADNKLETLINQNKNTDTYKKGKDIIQLIKIHKDSVYNFFDGFDFTLCQFAWDGINIYSTPNAIIDVGRKRLSVHKIQKDYELDSLRRAFKYQRKGYFPCSGTISEIAKSLSGMEAQEIIKQTEISPGGGKRTVRMD